MADFYQQLATLEIVATYTIPAAGGVCIDGGFSTALTASGGFDDTESISGGMLTTVDIDGSVTTCTD